MKAIITGMNGTVAPVVADVLAKHDIETVAWDRTKVSTTDESQMRTFLETERPDYFLHIGMGSVSWTDALVRLCQEYQIPFFFTSTVSVFSDDVPAPIEKDAVPDATDEYGAYKIACEQAIQAIDPQAKIVRIGWQIGTEAGSNNMVDFFTNEMKQHGVIQASRNWYPSSSLLEDTAEALVTILLEREAGLYQLNGNDRYSMYDLAHALNTLHAKNWTIEPVDEPRRDNRMATDVVLVRPLSERLPL
ncbi:sugar nucleotide-binding protein [Exiguobacterium indicum]|uniref:sugar nucleotide-binding protein n=1 Tax=Exiguobacterium sp. R-17 TaxID=3404054 RepID=UPI003221D11E